MIPRPNGDFSHHGAHYYPLNLSNLVASCICNTFLHQLLQSLQQYRYKNSLNIYERKITRCFIQIFIFYFFLKPEWYTRTSLYSSYFFKIYHRIFKNVSALITMLFFLLLHFLLSGIKLKRLLQSSLLSYFYLLKSILRSRCCWNSPSSYLHCIV